MVPCEILTCFISLWYFWICLTKQAHWICGLEFRYFSYIFIDKPIYFKHNRQVNKCLTSAHLHMISLQNRIFEFQQSQPRLDSSLFFNALYLQTTTLRREPWGEEFIWWLLPDAGAYQWVCVCVYFPQGLHRGWMLCCCYKWSCGRLTDSQARCGSTCLITTHTHTHITSLQLPTVSEACWSQSKLPLHILSAQRKCQSACPSQLKRCVYASKIYLTSCPSWLLTANNTVLAWTMPLF